MAAKSHDAFKRFNGMFPQDVVLKWAEMVTNWNKDQNKKNPYEEPAPSTSKITFSLSFTDYIC